MSIIRTLVDWTIETFKPYGVFGLFLLAFMESSFFPVPPDILLIILCIASPENALLFAAICTIGSVLGGCFGYFIGIKGGLPLLKRWVEEEKIKKVHNMFNKYEAWAIFAAGFTPIPFKIFTIAAGVLYINFKKFVIASFFSRGLRFFIEAILLMIFGSVIKEFINNYFDMVSISILLIILIPYIIIYRNTRKK